MIRVKSYFLFVLFTLFAADVFAQAEPAANKEAAKLFKQFYNAGQPDSIFKRFSPEMKAALPLDQFKTSTLQLKAQLGNLVNTEFVKFEAPLAVYKAKFEKAVFLLNIALNDKKQYQGLLLKPAEDNVAASGPVIDESLTETPYTVKTLSATISGSLVKPKSATGKVPLVLIIPGSGPTDRNGNNAKMGLHANDYVLLANELGKKGIATLRYDKLLVGQTVTPTKESELRLDDMTEAAVGIINDLNESGSFSRIIVLGHSEGSLIGMLAAQEAPAKAFISVAGAGESADKIMTEQMKSQPSYIADGFKRVLDSLRKGKMTPNVDPNLYFIARPSIQLYLMSWCRFDPARELKKLKVPVLLVQGTTDLQVNVAQVEKLKKAKSDAQLLLIPNMNHVLKDAPADKEANMATYNKPDLPLKPELVTGIVDFVNKLK
jgi:pimeloyl-ACP methyl ester carboxylesterase